ncbi:hypothetical protein CO005_00185 [Candidatus Roizmanbacteria bacterium CG_4_8_14_3_um_filter_34_9]|uniref:Uncharacterized protein n=3 Tax=Candidatus Roizmaniibacteriota TaxID=1752723 RepID=A0A2M7AV47_9BACT|nr:MAG: hypothetical protein COT02_02140 [Candidatus Roizmanbacteria bacterium CG07_land_8_20_14_0_80_34_15]PIU74433.1 MAG: hypothetical protein COS77_01500 [Candidatus Roizmanbacteria bacterium CG06_land_8_20_14_3_00_34_14]PIW73675.1 MAG: hypothetical protein CO005_00185 [Candidatus Roizmanbacteria bacterium CG_4_8_14_3_um_filter_34_9]
MKTKLAVKMGSKLIEILKRESAYADFALNSLNQETTAYEKKYLISGDVFIHKFENGEMGDDRELFNWYALVKFTQDWYDTKREIEKTLRDS